MDKEKTKLEELKEALFIKSYMADVSDKKHHVLGMTSHETEFQHKWSRYGTDIQRFLDHMEMTIFMLKNLSSIIEAASKNGWDETQLVPFYQGVFTSQLYGLKEKILQLLKLLTDEVPQSATHEKKIKLKKLMEREEIKKMGIDEILLVWDASYQNKTGIGVALRKRTHYQHYIDPFQLSKELVDLKFAKSMLSENSRPFLTELGIKEFQEMEIKNAKLVISDAINKAEKTLQEVRENLEQLSKAIMDHFNLSASPELIKEMQDKIAQFEDTTKIVNETDILKVPDYLMKLINIYLEELKNVYNEHLLSLYIYGSVPRGEFNPIFSDINLLIIVDDKSDLHHKSYLRNRRFFNPVFLTKSEFKSNTQEMKKIRFICQADGVLIHGSDLIGKESFPKPGLELAYLLNFDVINDINRYKKWLDENKTPSQDELNTIGRRFAKRHIDFLFGIAMTNDPYYTSSRLKRLEWIKSVFQDNGVVPDMMLAILRSEAIIDVKGMEDVIEVFKEQAELNMNEIAKVIKMIGKRK